MSSKMLNDCLQKWYDKGYLPKAATHDVMIGLFKEGKVGQFVTGPWNINEYQETFGKDLGVTTLPTDGGKPMKPFLRCTWLVFI